MLQVDFSTSPLVLHTLEHSNDVTTKSCLVDGTHWNPGICTSNPSHQTLRFRVALSSLDTPLLLLPQPRRPSLLLQPPDPRHIVTVGLADPLEKFLHGVWAGFTIDDISIAILSTDIMAIVDTHSPWIDNVVWVGAEAIVLVAVVKNCF